MSTAITQQATTVRDGIMLDLLSQLAEPFPTHEAIQLLGLTTNHAPQVLRRLGYLSTSSPGDKRRLLWARTPEAIKRVGQLSPRDRLTLTREQITIERGESGVYWTIPVPDDYQRMADAMGVGIELRVWPLMQ